MISLHCYSCFNYLLCTILVFEKPGVKTKFNLLQTGPENPPPTHARPVPATAWLHGWIILALQPRSGGKDLRASGAYPLAFGARVAALHQDWMAMPSESLMRLYNFTNNIYIYIYLYIFMCMYAEALRWRWRPTKLVTLYNLRNYFNWDIRTVD